MKRLFCLRDCAGKIMIEHGYFDNKPVAKEIRDGLEAICYVSPGPDHHKFRG